MTDDTATSRLKKIRTIKPVETVRNTALEAAERTAQAIEGNPMSVLVGGLALGVIAGALIPRSAREGELLRPLGARLKDGASAAIRAARDAGAAELASAGISSDAARQQIGKLVDAVSNAATRAGEAVTKPTKGGSE
ncbi:MAG: hypothetical protein K2P68_04265 [Sphingomonas sp.]|nr:hypothetical protein [Sphingomonas sp.]